MEHVILVDEQDNEIGIMEKMEAHVQGKLHRAISVFIFNTKGEMLLQQRAAHKYHSSLLWTNACCSHPRPRETAGAAAVRRLQEEMGMTCDLKEAFSFVYRAHLDKGLTEHEYDHVFTGTCDMAPIADADEVAAWKYISMEDLERDIASHPENYTEWFKICINNYRKELFI